MAETQQKIYLCTDQYVSHNNNRVHTIGKSRKFCKGISRPGKSREKCVLILNNYEKQFGKSSALHLVETNTIEADDY